MNDDVLNAGFYQQFFKFLEEDETYFDFSALDAAQVLKQEIYYFRQKRKISCFNIYKWQPSKDFE